MQRERLRAEPLDERRLPERHKLAERADAPFFQNAEQGRGWREMRDEKVGEFARATDCAPVGRALRSEEREVGGGRKAEAGVEMQGCETRSECV